MCTAQDTEQHILRLTEELAMLQAKHVKKEADKKASGGLQNRIIRASQTNPAEVTELCTRNWTAMSKYEQDHISKIARNNAYLKQL